MCMPPIGPDVSRGFLLMKARQAFKDLHNILIDLEPSEREQVVKQLQLNIDNLMGKAGYGVWLQKGKHMKCFYFWCKQEIIDDMIKELFFGHVMHYKCYKLAQSELGLVNC